MTLVPLIAGRNGKFGHGWTKMTLVPPIAGRNGKFVQAWTKMTLVPPIAGRNGKFGHGWTKMTLVPPIQDHTIVIWSHLWMPEGVVSRFADSSQRYSQRMSAISSVVTLLDMTLSEEEWQSAL